jgi:hypothetical protein
MKFLKLSCLVGFLLLVFQFSAFGQDAATRLTLSAPANNNPTVNLKTPLTPRYLVLPARNINPATIRSQAASNLTIPLWANSVNSEGNTYVYQMVGKDPSIPLLQPSSSVKTSVIPIIFNFQPQNVTFDPTVVDPVCSPQGAPSALTLTSPIFVPHDYTVGGTDVGKDQYLDFFQRANFWQYTNPAGINPNYHVKLAKLAQGGVGITANNFSIFTGGTCPLGMIEINSWDAFLQQSLFPFLAANGYAVTPKNFPIFLFYNVVLYIGDPSNCCVIGYHSAFSNGGVFQTYAVADYEESGAFVPAIQDVAALSHEVGEWMNDPSGANPTPPWGHIGQVSGCQTNLEVGDPLTGTDVGVTLHTFAYHVQELAFFSWFYDQVPSLGVNGWYSSNGTFTSPAVPCT